MCACVVVIEIVQLRPRLIVIMRGNKWNNDMKPLLNGGSDSCAAQTRTTVYTSMAINGITTTQQKRSNGASPRTTVRVSCVSHAILWTSSVRYLRGDILKDQTQTRSSNKQQYKDNSTKNEG